MYKIKEVAEMAGVSVRTLHHYDHIDLLKPAMITEAGYRLYTDENLERLQQILFFKELGFTLQQIKDIIDRPDFDRKQALNQQREWLVKKKKRLEIMIETVERTIQSLEGERKMEGKELFTGFNMEEIKAHQKKYADETKQKYGKEMVEKVERKTNGYNEQDWANIMSQWEDIYKRIISRMDNGHADAEVQKAVHELRMLFSTYFYDCTVDIFRGLADLYVTDERFTKNIDRYKEGLAAFLQKAMHHYCDLQQ